MGHEGNLWFGRSLGHTGTICCQSESIWIVAAASSEKKSHQLGMLSGFVQKWSVSSSISCVFLAPLLHALIPIDVGMI